MKRLLALMVFLAMACGPDEGDPLTDAWVLFQDGLEDGNYAPAHTAFADLVATQPGEAYAGLGWTTMKMDSLSQSNYYFTLAGPDSLLHAYAGWAITSRTLGNNAACINQAGFVLGRAPGFTFNYYEQVTSNTMNLIQALGYFHTNNLTASINSIRLIDGAFSLASTQQQVLDKLTALSQTYINAL